MREKEERERERGPLKQKLNTHSVFFQIVYIFFTILVLLTSFTSRVNAENSEILEFGIGFRGLHWCVKGQHHCDDLTAGIEKKML